MALSRIEHVEHVERGKVQVAGRLLPVGDTYRDAFATPSLRSFGRTSSCSVVAYLAE